MGVRQGGAVGSARVGGDEARAYPPGGASWGCPVRRARVADTRYRLAVSRCSRRDARLVPSRGALTRPDAVGLRGYAPGATAGIWPVSHLRVAGAARHHRRCRNRHRRHLPPSRPRPCANIVLRRNRRPHRVLRRPQPPHRRRCLHLSKAQKARHASDAQFCSAHTCIKNFPNGNGTVVQCADGEWSHSGGLSGECSDHGGDRARMVAIVFEQLAAVGAVEPNAASPHPFSLGHKPRV